MGRDWKIGRARGEGTVAALRALITATGCALVASIALAFPAVSRADTPPSVTIDPATEVSYTSAHVSGAVNPNGGPSWTFWRFEWTTEPADPSSWHWSNVSGFIGEAAAEGTSPVAVSGRMQNLPPGATVSLRLTAENAGGDSSTEAPYPSLTTQPVAAPSVAIAPVSAVSATSAHFSGTIDPNGDDPAFNANWHFECTPACPGFLGGTVAADGSGHEVSVDATGLEPNRGYEVRLIASNAGGTAEAGPLGFHTASSAPWVETLFAGSIGTTSATLAANVNPRNSSATYQFEWGAGGAFDHVAPAAPADLGAADNSLHLVTATVAGLAPGTEYRFRVAATNTETSQSAVGASHSFQTVPPSPPQEPCPNEAIRSEQGAAALPGCRAYELVSPPDKNGGAMTQVVTSTPDGSRVGAFSSASFGDPHSNLIVSPYVSVRGAGGWTTHNLSPVAGVALGVDGFLQAGLYSADLETAYSTTRSGPQQPNVKNIFAVSIDGTRTWITAPKREGVPRAAKLFAGRSADGSRIVFESTEEFSPRDTFGTNQVWEWENGAVRLVSELPDGSLGEGVIAGNGANALSSDSTGTAARYPEHGLVSRDGSLVFFSAFGMVDPHRQLYVREGDSQTVEVSLSQRPGSVGQESQSSVEFVEAAADGSAVLFTSADLLTADATPGGGLYRYDLDSGKLEFLTPAASGGPGYEGLVGASEDLSRVYFVASARLLAGEGQAGAPNLYLWDPAGLHFIATLVPKDHLDWTPTFGAASSRTAKAAPDGRHLAFQSYQQLTGYPTAAHSTVYEWDAEHRSLACVSCGAPGTESQGDASLNSAPVDPETGLTESTDQVGEPRGLSDDGSRVFFQTTQGLVPRDVNGKYDVYMYERGRTYLVSSGTGPRNSEVLDNSASGDDVFFTTTDSLVSQDSDHGAGDVYDARVAGGFPGAQVAGACEGSDCQAGGSAPPFTTPASAELNGREAGRGPGAARRRALTRCRQLEAKQARKRCVTRVKRHFSHGGGAR